MQKEFIIEHMKTKIYDKQMYITTTLYCNEDKITICKINTSNEGKKWTISEWFTEEKYQHLGFGKVALEITLKELMKKYGEPNEIEYIWNGTNQYVYDWLEEEFDATCECPIAIQKTQAEDDFQSHMYILNKYKVLRYFKIQ